MCNNNLLVSTATCVLEAFKYSGCLKFEGQNEGQPQKTSFQRDKLYKLKGGASPSGKNIGTSLFEGPRKERAYACYNNVFTES